MDKSFEKLVEMATKKRFGGTKGKSDALNREEYEWMRGQLKSPKKAKQFNAKKLLRIE